MSCRWQNFLIEKDQSFEILYTSGNKPSSAAEASGEFFFFFFFLIFLNPASDLVILLSQKTEQMAPSRGSQAVVQRSSHDLRFKTDFQPCVKVQIQILNFLVPCLKK